jgi:hypothetical protein
MKPNGFRQLKTNGEKYQQNMLICSVGKLKKVAKLVELLGKIIAPYTADIIDKGAEKIDFELEDYVEDSP